MKPSSYLTISSAALIAAAPDALITPRPELARRQNDPALLGWIDGNISAQRTCDYPATLSTSGSLAQCCGTSSCTFWQSCSGGTLFAQQTSLRCDQGFCNTAIVVPTLSATSGQNYLGCWATSLGPSPFTIVKNIGSAQATTRSTTGAAGSSANSGGTSNAPTSAAGSGTATQASAASSHTNAAAAIEIVKPLTYAFGLFGAFLGLL